MSSDTRRARGATKGRVPFSSVLRAVTPIAAAAGTGASVAVLRAAALFLAAAFAFTAALLLSGCGLPQEDASYKRDFPDKSREVFITNDRAETISVFQPDSGKLHNDVFPVGRAPNDIFFYDGKLFVVCSLDNSIEIYDESTFSYEGDTYLGSGKNPYSIIGDASGGSPTAYVPNYADDSVSVIDLDKEKVIATISHSSLNTPQDGVIHDGHLFVCNTANTGGASFGDGSVSIFEINGPKDYDFVAKVETGDGSNPQTALSLPSKDEVHVYLTGTQNEDDGEVLVLDTTGLSSGTTPTEKARLPIGGSPSFNAGAYDGAAGTAYLTGTYGLSRYDAAGNSIPGSPSNPLIETDDPSGDLLGGVIVDTVYDILVVTNFGSDSLVIIDKSSYKVVDTLQASDGPLTPLLVVE